MKPACLLSESFGGDEEKNELHGHTKPTKKQTNKQKNKKNPQVNQQKVKVRDC